MPSCPSPRVVRRCLVVLLAVPLLAGCGRDPKARGMAGPPPQAVIPGPPPLGPDANGDAPVVTARDAATRALLLRVEPYESVQHVFRHAESRLQQSVRLVVHDSLDWRMTWRHLVGQDAVTPPPVDFSRDMLVVVAMGPKPCMGYGISVDTVLRDDAHRIFVVVRQRERGVRCGCLPDPVSPVDVIRVPRTIRPVTFLERVETNVCEEH